MAIDAQQLLDMYRKMVTIRTFDQMAVDAEVPRVIFSSSHRQ